MNWYKTALEWNEKGVGEFADKSNDFMWQREQATAPSPWTGPVEKEHEVDQEGLDAKTMTQVRVVELRNPETNDYGKKLTPPEILKVLQDEGYRDVNIKDVVKAIERFESFSQLSDEDIDRLIDEAGEDVV